jgi:diguanylate cyclase (GGDEF)-like protein/PAS domain S-box-containing protein
MAPADRRRGSWAIRTAAFAVVYYAASRLGLALVAPDHGVAAMWPASGVALAAFALADARRWPALMVAVFVGNLAAQLQARGPIDASVALAAVNVAEASLAAWTLGIVAGRRCAGFETVRDVAGLAAAAVGANAVTSLVGAGIVCVGFGAPLGAAWSGWWLADGLGMLAFAPVGMVLSRDARNPRAPQAELLALVAACVALTAAIFLAPEARGLPLVLGHPSLVLPVLIWGAVRLGPRGAGIALLIVGAGAAWGTVHGLGPFARTDWSPADRVLSVQGFLLVAVLCTLTVAATTQERRAAARQATVERERFAAVLRAATGYAIVATDPEGLITVFNRGAERLLGHTAGDVVGTLPLTALLDRDEVAARAGELGLAPGFEVLVAAARRGDSETREWSYRHRDGHAIPVQLTVTAMRSPTGDLDGFIGIAEDLTDRRRAQHALQVHAEQLEDHARALERIAQLNHAVPDGRDLPTEICEASMAVARADAAFLLRLQAGELVTAATATTGARVPDVRLIVGRERSGAALAYASQQPLFVPDVEGDPRLAHRHVHALRARAMLFEPVVRGGESVGVLVLAWRQPVDARTRRSLSAVTLLAREAAQALERAELHARLESAARTDALTGLANRRSWDDALPRALAHAARHPEPLCVALLDLDHFKHYNDTHGHPAGDRLLKEAAAAWQQLLRDDDLLARYGGEEFAVLLPDCPPDHAQQVLERLRRATPKGQTCSVGLAHAQPGEAPHALLARVDAALYAAKGAGRDRTVTA